MEQSQRAVENSQEQPENTADGGIGGSEEQNKIDYEKQYKELQAEYTRLRQQQKPAEETPEDDDKSDIIRSLREDYGLMTKEDFEQIESKKSRLANLDQIVSERPELKGLKNAIRQLGENSDKSWDEVISENFSDISLPAGSPGIVGNSNIPSRQPDTKPISSMTREEFARYKNELGINNPFIKRR